MKKINDFLINNKKIALAIPIGVILVISLIFVNLPKEKKENKKQSNADLTLPEASSNPLPENKIDVFNEFDKYSENTQADLEKNRNFNLQEEDLMGKEKVNNNTTYQAPSSEVSSKLDAMLARMEENKKTRNSYTTPTTSRTSPSTSVSSKKENKVSELDEFKKQSQESFNDFFKNSNNSSNSNISKNISNVSDEKIYAVVYGDQYIKNNDRVTLMLSRDAVINGQIYKANTSFYAIANFAVNRVNLKVTNINNQSLKLYVQDAQDGNPGIYIEGESLLKESVSTIEDDQVKDIDVAGVPVGKTIKKIFTAKKKETKVQLLNNYKLILKTQK